MLTSKQTGPKFSTDVLNPPVVPPNPNAVQTRTDISFKNVVEELVLPVIADPAMLKLLRGLLGNISQLSNTSGLNDQKRGKAGEEIDSVSALLNKIERSEKVPLNQSTLDLLRSFYRAAFRPRGVALMSEANQVALRDSISQIELPKKEKEQWEKFRDSIANKKLPLVGFAESTLIMHALVARCYSK